MVAGGLSEQVNPSSFRTGAIMRLSVRQPFIACFLSAALLVGWSTVLEAGELDEALAILAEEESFTGYFTTE